MTLRPEQVKAKEYLHAKGTRLTASQVRERVTAGFAALEAFLDGVTEAEARTRALPGEWTVHEVVDHLVETHRPSLEELRDLLAGRRPPGAPIPAGLQSSDPMARPWPELVAELRRIQALVVATLESVPDTLTDARAPVVMVINVKDADGRETPLHWIEELDWKAYAVIFRLHVLDHLGQARKVVHAARGA
ncbi:MAG TPA: DinB family protein [Methylomirabilota bacterium]